MQPHGQTSGIGLIYVSSPGICKLNTGDVYRNVSCKNRLPRLSCKKAKKGAKVFNFCTQNIGGKVCAKVFTKKSCGNSFARKYHFGTKIRPPIFCIFQIKCKQNSLKNKTQLNFSKVLATIRKSENKNQNKTFWIIMKNLLTRCRTSCLSNETDFGSQLARANDH